MINVLVWLLLGMVAGALANQLRRSHTPMTLAPNSTIGVMGALTGGVVFLIFDNTPLNALSLGAIVFALVGALLMIMLAYFLDQRPS